ncbi:MAG: Kelch repeat-containing protein [Bacteroidales bacterium]
MKITPRKNWTKALLLVGWGILCTGEISGQHWETMESTGKMDPRNDCGFISSEGIFYLLGGHGIQPVNIFDHDTGEWTEGAAPPIEMHHFQAISFRGKIYVMGGLTGSYPDIKPLEYIYIYDPHEDKWTVGDPIPEDRRRGSSGAVAYRGQFYLVCGIIDGMPGSHTRWLDRYDPESGEWKKLADAPHNRDHFHVVVIDGEIYAAGGRNTISGAFEQVDHTIAEVDVYNIKSNRWTTLPDSLNLPTPRAGCTAAAWNDQLLVIGGESAASEEAHREVEVLDVDHKKWIKFPDLNQGRHGTQAFMCIGSVFIASGSATRGDGNDLESIEELIFYE